MSIIKTFKSEVFGGHLNVEIYQTAQQVADDLEVRTMTSDSFKQNPYADRRFVGASREETYKMLREGYQPVVDSLKAKLRASATTKRFKSYNDVAGYQPIIPNAIMGLPKSMINSSLTPIKMKVIDIYYESTVPAYRDADELIKAGSKMLGVITELEGQGYRFNLYITQGYYDKKLGTDMLCLKVKSANQPLDLKRMSFPIAHTSFFRGMGFDWYSKFPKGTFRSGYGQPISCNHTHEEIQNEYRKFFGKNAIYFSAEKICHERDKAEDYIREVLTSGK